MAGSSTDVCLEYVKKGKATILLRAGHQYSKKCKYKNGGVLWECTTRKQSKCAGSITVMVSYLLYFVINNDNNNSGYVCYQYHVYQYQNFKINVKV